MHSKGLTIIPAIDLRGGRCVRLVQGDYDRETVFSDDPVEVARGWQAAGARMLHVVDLDGARDGVPAQRDVIRAIVAALDIPVQVGGGVRSVEHGTALFDAGVQRVVIGTAAIEQPELVDRLLAAYGPERVIIGVDARNGLVATRGWTETSDITAEALIAGMRERGIQRVVYTDIDRDGTLVSPNFDAIARIGTLGVAVVASGGVATRDHLQLLATIPGVDEAIVGRALYTGDVVLTGDEWKIEP
ncbi:MAG TPA: 1-(5-phosphoribosyl)-5-[(5-phosphoribosylamino)methylideneamino]imidazole-4-carboxamide isomerase [Thermomicrobiales bacterium]|nr:1-(5-phosphoribosyl)-5-[(5-phosphoribosylamino)methylideneamino]imidazole-4-carboxamide isomerase [Thermomicrobiales bacterium]